MNLNPTLLATLTSLGLSEAEVSLLESRMMSAVTSLEAQLNALNAQISTLSVQRDAIAEELAVAQVTVAKLLSQVR